MSRARIKEVVDRGSDKLRIEYHRRRRSPGLSWTIQTTAVGFDEERERSTRALREFQARNGFRIVDNQGHRFTIDRIQRYSKISLIETSA